MAAQKVDFRVNETLTYSSGGITAVERRDVDHNITNVDLTYVLTDSLGTHSQTVKPVGTSVRYLPFGEERWVDVDMPTDRGYTGQRNEAGFGPSRLLFPAIGQNLLP